MVRSLTAWLLVEAALGMRVPHRARAMIQATTSGHSSGRWTAKAPPGFFKSGSVSFAFPDGNESHFACRTEPSASSALDAGLEVMEGAEGDSQLTAVKQSSGVVVGTIVDAGSGMIHQFSGEEGGELSFKSTASSEFPSEGDPLQSSDAADVVDEDNGTAVQNVEMGLMVLWTRESECVHAGLSGGCAVTSDTYHRMLGLVELAVVETNRGYANSGINGRIRLVHSYRTDYREPSFGDALNH